jgi:23S rRNA (adenine2030-N6)-methyltransferase
VNYLHAFHAGNFADVHKHIVLLMLLEHLRKKPKPFFVLDTHAGRGLYDLKSEEAQRGGEWQNGVAKVTASQLNFPEISAYLQAIQQSPSGERALRFYPGSPLLIAGKLRENDRAVFVEQQPEEAAALRNELRGRTRVSVLAQDGYAAIKANLPPKENRGLVLIDPPFEVADEFERLAKALQLGLERWPNGMFCAWYPIKADATHLKFHRQLKDAGLKKLLLSEFNIKPVDSPLGLNGSGLLIANPPYQLDERMRAILSALHLALSSDRSGGVKVEWLAGE